MFQKQPHIPETQLGEFLDLNRDDVRAAILFAQTEGLHETEEALIDLLLLLDEVSTESGKSSFASLPV